ncbi:MAG: LytR C-terminal domain-containing protein, partial [Actinomycetota bacterium]
MNLGTARIVVVVALVVGGIAVLANGFGSGTILAGPPGGSSSPTVGSSGSPSSRPSKPPKQLPSPQIHGVAIAVFNGTNTVGLAGQVEQTLEADGYVKAQDPADAPSKPVAKTVVYFRGG